jgi:hypothetical protein
LRLLAAELRKHRDFTRAVRETQQKHSRPVAALYRRKCASGERLQSESLNEDRCAGRRFAARRM